MRKPLKMADRTAMTALIVIGPFQSDNALSLYTLRIIKMEINAIKLTNSDHISHCHRKLQYLFFSFGGGGGSGAGFSKRLAGETRCAVNAGDRALSRRPSSLGLESLLCTVT